MIRTVAAAGEHETEVRRSRFLCALARVRDEAQAREFIRTARKRHWNATHNASAYIVGESGQAQKSNDDGEPAGTAGVPMLEGLRRRGLTDTAAVVTRWFGGEKLGAGGLIRAYGSAVSAALDAVGVVERRPVALIALATDHVLAGRLERDLRAAGQAVREARYSAGGVEFEVGVAQGEVEAFTAWLAKSTGGSVRARVAGRVYTEVRVGGRADPPRAGFST